LYNLAWSTMHIVPRYSVIIIASVAGLLYVFGRLRKASEGAGEDASAITRSQRIAYLTLCLWYLSAVLVVASTGRFAAHYFNQFFPPAALLGGIWIADSFQVGGLRLPSGKLNLAALLLAMQLLLLVPGLAMNVGYWRQALEVSASGSPWRHVGEYIGRHTSPDETVFVWGGQNEVLYWAGRELASRDPWITNRLLGFRHKSALFASRISQKIEWEQFSQLLEQWRPAYVVICPVVLTAPPELAMQFGTRQLPRLGEILSCDYEYETTISYYELYRRRDLGAMS